jgi:hypothetical protein
MTFDDMMAQADTVWSAAESCGQIAMSSPVAPVIAFVDGADFLWGHSMQNQQRLVNGQPLVHVHQVTFRVDTNTLLGPVWAELVPALKSLVQLAYMGEGINPFDTHKPMRHLCFTPNYHGTSRELRFLKDPSSAEIFYALDLAPVLRESWENRQALIMTEWSYYQAREERTSAASRVEDYHYLDQHQPEYLQ